ncbi:aminotransferase DegT [Kiloniella litopenaei]|uniref:Aminotransferase DegT n=1 Tax=Kiloniella litopenaei TaxID=1549748 RepID=A0A0M2R578_9PROT|nr:DegT/DnrJ/EryC1/StrS aminotransferase family protein [Kiloniella litopenaei]KKJ77022.1 aminotransferase DegT [Kiloniella litopenaei]
MSEKIPFIDLESQQVAIKPAIEVAISKVLTHGKYILGPEVYELEKRLADFCGAKNVVTCANGTDALSLVLMAEGIGSGDAVFVPAFTFVATAEAVAQLGAIPFLVDIRPDTYNIDSDSLEKAVFEAKKSGLKPQAIIAVDLFGLPADYDVLKMLADREELILISDAAQSFGATYKGRSVGTLASYTTTSFFPAKPLGGYGDGGAVFTDDDDKAELLRSLRFHGRAEDKYDNIRVGLNSRLDTLQAAVLLEKLNIFSNELLARQKVAERYSNALGKKIIIPKVPEGLSSSWAQYTVCIENRGEVFEAGRQAGIPTAIYYPLPLNKQTGYETCPIVSNGVYMSEFLSERVLSLPMHPYLGETAQDMVISMVLSAAT